MRLKYTFLSSFSIPYSRESLYQNMSFGRLLITKKFLDNILPLIEDRDFLEVCVIGGYSDEPEIQLLQNLGIRMSTTTFGIDKSNHYLDLNVIATEIPNVNYDLILFSQTLEHIWNHASAFANLSNIASPGTLLWVSCPASNRFHGSPDYFSAGFTPDYLERNLASFGFSVLASGNTGSVRNYLATHLLPYWLSPKAHFFPLIFGAESYRFINRVALGFFTFPIRLILILVPSRITENPRWVTESWAFFVSK